MLRETFIGKYPSSFQVNNIVKAFIVSETFLWSAWNFVIPIFAVFAATEIPGGSVEIAASAFSTYLIVRVIFELISGRYLVKTKESKEYTVTILGIILLSIAYFGFATTKTVLPLYLFYSILGIGVGIASPAKNALFSTHLDKNKEPVEWGIHDAAVFSGMALSATLGGFIATKLGFSILFILAGIINLIGIIPYFLYLKKDSPENNKKSN